MVSYRQTGVQDALSAFGLEKIALNFGQTAKKWLIGDPNISWGQAAKRMAIGEPGKAYSDFQQGKLFKPGGAIHNQIFPKDTFGRVMTYGMPLLGLAGALSAPSHQRGEAIGQFAAGTIGGTLGLPLGMLGATAGSILLAPLGRSIGKMFDKKPPSRDPQTDGFVQNGVSS